MSCITKALVLQETETSVSLPSHKQAMQWTAGKKQRSDSRPRTSASDWTAAKAPFSPTSWTKAQSLTSTTLTHHQTTAMSLSGKVRTLGMCLVTVCLKIKVKMDPNLARSTEFATCVHYSALKYFHALRGPDKWPTAIKAVAKMWCNCPCVSTLLPSSFSLGRNVSMLWLETRCRPATGQPLSGGKMSGNFTLSSFILSIDHLSNQPLSPDDGLLITHSKESRMLFSLFLHFQFAWHATLHPLPFLIVSLYVKFWYLIARVRYEALVALIRNERRYNWCC